MATDPLPCPTTEDFLRIRFGPDVKAELDEGVIRMMTGARRRHAVTQRDVFAFFVRARGDGPCQPYGPDMAVRATDPTTGC